MRREVEKFANDFAGVAPDGHAFAESLTHVLLLGQPGSSDDCSLEVAGEIYDEFAVAFCAHSWKEPRLRVGRRVVLRAAALASVPAADESITASPVLARSV